MAIGFVKMMVLAARGCAAVIAFLSLGSIFLLWTLSDAPSDLGVAEARAVVFTVAQALASAVLAVLFAVPFARALFHQRFPGRDLLISGLGAIFVLPPIAAALGILMAFGPNGMIAFGMAKIGGEWPAIYGVGGVVLAHVFLNLPLAARMLLGGWSAIPAERRRLAESLGLSPWGHFRFVEMPMLGQVVPGAFLAIFLVCTTSFSIALILGGGPRATTVELLIYQAIRYEFDLGKAAILSLVQVGIMVAATGAIFGLAPKAVADPGQGTAFLGAARAGMRRVLDLWVIGVVTSILILPLGALFWGGIGGLGDAPGSLVPAAMRSLAVAGLSSVITTAVALTLTLGMTGKDRSILEALAMSPMACSALVMGTALFVATRPLPTQDIALGITLLVNVTFAVPFALRILLPEARRVRADYGRLAHSLNLSARAELRWLVLPRLKKSLCFSAALTAALSMGDLGVITLFAGPGTETLPLAIAQLAGAYRIGAAAAGTALLVFLTFGIFWSIDRLGAKDVDA